MSGVHEERLYPAEKRVKFFRESQWDEFDKLLLDAGLLVMDDAGELTVNAKRVARRPPRGAHCRFVGGGS